MRAPTDGLAGRLWRRISFPARVSAPIVLLARRALRGDYWVEHEQEHDGAGPPLDVSEHVGIQRPGHGAGPLNHRRYSVRIVDSALGAEELMGAFRRDPNQFGPTSYATFVPSPEPLGLVAGDSYEVKLPGPWDGPVHVRTIEPRRIRLETLDGHMEAGWIEFTASAEAHCLVFAIESFARSGDPAFDYLYHQIGIAKLVQTEMWVSVLESAVATSGGEQEGRIEIETTTYMGADQ